MSEDETETRSQWASLARSKRTRLLGFPRDWNPASVWNPGTGMFFTDVGAWYLVADLFESGQAYEVIELNEPPGQSALVMLIQLDEKYAPIYIKVQIGINCIIGRSFHYSYENNVTLN